MAKVNLRKAASYVAKANTGAIDINVANTSEAIKDFLEYLIDNHTMAERVEMFERRE